MQPLWMWTEEFEVWKRNLEQAKFALIANFVHGYTPHGISAALAIGSPKIDFVETTRTSVTGEAPQEGLFISLGDQLGASS